MKKFEAKNLKIPHMGWNNITIKDGSLPCFSDIRSGEDFYFVHSYQLLRLMKIISLPQRTMTVDLPQLWGRAT